MSIAAPDPSDWLNQQLRVTQAADRQVLRAVEDARLDTLRMLRGIANRPGIGAAIRRHQLLLVKRNMLRTQAVLWRRLGDIIRARRLEAAARNIQLSQDLDSMLLRATRGGVKLAKSIADAERDTAERSLDRLIARVNGASYVPLSQRVYNSEVTIGARVDRLVNSAITRGLSAVEFAREVRDFINPNTPGGIRYAALRLSRTEINNAAHAVAIDAQRDKPWVTGMDWRLSGSHPRPDTCDQLAHDGPYEVSETPAKPHPHCFCFVVPVTVPAEKFLDNLVAGKYNDYLARYRGLSAGETVLTKLG
jgi:hypothetical protein